jgi:hypothetical protein
MRAFALANLALRFLLELALLGAFAYWGFTATGNTLVNILLGLGAPLLVGVFWGVFMAPTSSRRATGIAYIILETILFSLATLALVAAGQPVIAGVFAVLFVLNAIAFHLTEQHAGLPERGERGQTKQP